MGVSDLNFLAELLSQKPVKRRKKKILRVSKRIEINAEKWYHKVKAKLRSKKGCISQRWLPQQNLIDWWLKQ